MILTDPFVLRTLHPGEAWRYVIEGVLIVGVVVAGKLISAAGPRRAPDHMPAQ